MPVVIVGQKNWSRANLTSSLSLRCVKSLHLRCVSDATLAWWGGNGIIIIIVIQREFEFSSRNSQTILGILTGSRGLGPLGCSVSLYLFLHL